MDYSIPEGLPQDLADKLLNLQREFEVRKYTNVNAIIIRFNTNYDGDITEKGYKKRRDAILASWESGKAGTSPESPSPSASSTRASMISGGIDYHPENYSSDQSLYGHEATLTMTSSIADGSIAGSSLMEDWETNPQVTVNNYRSTATPAQIPGHALASMMNKKLLRPLEPREAQDAQKALDQAQFDNIPSILRHRGKNFSATKTPALTVLDQKGKELNSIAWDKLASKAEKVAQMIRDKSGLYRGDRITLLYHESEVIEFAVALLGCFLAGMVAVPLPATTPFRDIELVLSNTQSHLAFTTDSNMKALQKLVTVNKLKWPRGVEWWRTNEFGSYHPPKNTELAALQVPDLAYIEFARSPLGELRGVVMSHRTILHQMTCLTAMLKCKSKHKQETRSATAPEIVLCAVDMRQSIGLIIGVLLTVYSGNHAIWIPQSAMAVSGLYANAISRFRATVLLADYPSLKQVTYNYQSFPHLTRNYSKRHTVDFSSVRWCLIDALMVDSEFHEVLADRWLRPLGNKNPWDVVTPMLTLSEHGGMVISMRDWLEGHERMGCNLNQVVASDDEPSLDPFDLSEVLIDKSALASNTISVITSAPARNSISEDHKTRIRVGAFGFPLPDATLAVVNPETCILSPEMEVGEIWIDSPSLSGGFWGLVRETDVVFHATCYDLDGPIDMEFLRTGLLGFVYNGKIYILGLYEDRLRQKIDEDDLNNEDPAAQSALKPTGLVEYRYHYSSHLVHTIMRGVPRVFDCSAFDIFVNGEHLPIIVLESALAAAPSTNQGVVTTAEPEMNQAALNEMCEKCIEVLYNTYRVRVYCVLVSPTNSLPRITRSGRSEIGNMLCKRRFENGHLPAVFVKFGVDRAIRNLPVGQDINGGIWSPAISNIRTDSLGDAEKQYSGVDFRDVVIDDRTAAPLSDFSSIIHILQWRISHQSDELAFSTIDSRAKEGKGVSWKKFDQRVGTVATYLKTKAGLRPRDAAILMYTHSEDFVVSVYACLLLGITPIPVSPIDSARLNEDTPAILSLIRDYSVKAILLNNETESLVKVKAISQSMKLHSQTAKVVVPPYYNTGKVKVSNSATTKDHQMQPAWFADDFPALVWAYWTPDFRSTCVQLSHKAIMGMCKIQKETSQLSSTRPVVGCVRSTTGLGFLHTCFMGVYLGASTFLVSPVDFANNPATFFLTLSRYKVKDTYATPQMLDHACNAMKPKGFSLGETKNIMVITEGRPRTDIVKMVRILFSSTGLESTSINLGYSHVMNPLITTRSYMSIEPIDLWLDPIALRQGLTSIVNPENYKNALHLHDSGMVPISTQVAIVNPETCRLCRVGEYGEIWVFSEGNISGFYRSTDSFSTERLHGKIVDGNSKVEYIRTGDLGFLHTITKGISGGGTLEMQTLFVLGSIGETFEVLGLSHFPIDVEGTVERCHKIILPGGSAIFQAGGLVILVVEINSSSMRNATIAGLVPVIVNSVLNEHQFVIDIVAFVSKGDFPRSRLGEKQRGKILSSWVNKKLNILAQFGVSQGETTLVKSINRMSTMTLEDDVDAEAV